MYMLIVERMHDYSAELSRGRVQYSCPVSEFCVDRHVSVRWFLIGCLLFTLLREREDEFF